MTILFTEEKRKLGSSALRVMKAIGSKWPTNPLEVAEELGDRGSSKTLSAKYLYHFKKLHGMELIQMKKTGNTYIAWPTDIEKLRIIHEMVKV